MKNVNFVFYLLIMAVMAPADLSFAQTTDIQKCGVNTFAVRDECGVGVFKNAQVECYDQFKEHFGGKNSCKSSDVWRKYGEERCADRCSIESGSVSKKPPPSEGILLGKPIAVCVIDDGLMKEYTGRILELQKLEQTGAQDQRSKEAIKSITQEINTLKERIVESQKECEKQPSKPEPRPTAVCVIPDGLMKEYNGRILELQKLEQPANKEIPAKEAEAITSEIVALKQRIAESQKEECDRQSKDIAGPVTTTGILSRPATIDRCAEVLQWADKISYYKKLGDLNDDELKKEAGFSRPEIDRIISELFAGFEKVKAQCDTQNIQLKKTQSGTVTVVVPPVVSPNATAPSLFLAESVKPVAVESGLEIGAYYKERIEKITASAKNTEEQITGLKMLRNEIDELIANLIKSRKEIEASEFNNIVEEVKISKGVIKADNVSVEAADKKIFVEVGNKPISIESTVSGVLIKDKDLEVKAAEVSIKDGMLEVGGAEVKLTASDVAEKMGIAPRSTELKEQNAMAVYEMKVSERRRLFGLIPLVISKVITADAKNGMVTEELAPWYTFLTIKR